MVEVNHLLQTFSAITLSTPDANMKTKNAASPNDLYTAIPETIKAISSQLNRLCTSQLILAALGVVASG